MEHHSLIFTVFLIFAGAAIFSTLALYLKQSLLVAYMGFGVIFGPWGLKVITDIDLIHRVDGIGTIFLMFLLGLHLKPQSLMRVIYKTIWVTLISSLIFFLVGFVIGQWYGYSLMENLIIGSCMMFSSTIVGLKLLPTNIEKHQYIRETMMGVLLLQDLLAVLVLLIIDLVSDSKGGVVHILSVILALPAILLFVFVAERLVLKKIFAKFAEVREYMLLVAIAWCLGVAQLAETVGLSHEIGAFIAGITIAASPIVIYISSQLQPIRDFFLVLFFFIIGASFNLHYFNVIVVPALIFTIIFVVLKPLVFRWLLHRAKEAQNVAEEVGIRLGQLSEFAFLVILLASSSGLIGHSIVYLIQAVTMLMFIASSYFVVSHYPGQDSMEPVVLGHDSPK